MDDQTISNIENIYATLYNFLNSHDFIKQNNIHVIFIGGFALLEIITYRDYMTHFPVLKTEDIDIKLLVTNKEIEKIDVFYNVLSDLVYYMRSYNVSYTIHLNKNHVGVYSDVYDICVDYPGSNILLESYKYIYYSSDKKYMNDEEIYKAIATDVSESGVNIKLCVYNVVYLFIHVYESIKNNNVSNRIPKISKVLSRFLMIYHAVAKPDDKEIEELKKFNETFQTIMDYLLEIQENINIFGKNNELKLKYLIKVNETLYSHIKLLYRPDEYSINIVGTENDKIIYNMCNTALQDSTTSLQIYDYVYDLLENSQESIEQRKKLLEKHKRHAIGRELLGQEGGKRSSKPIFIERDILTKLSDTLVGCEKMSDSDVNEMLIMALL